MRRRELVKLLGEYRSQLVAQSGIIFTGGQLGAQNREKRRLEVLHALESLLPEIIVKLGSEGKAS